MQFASDNAGPAHPAILEAIARANDGHQRAYGSESAMSRVRDRIRDIFEAPQAEVHLVATGTAANALILGCMARPGTRCSARSTPMSSMTRATRPNSIPAAPS